MNPRAYWIVPAVVALGLGAWYFKRQNDRILALEAAVLDAKKAEAGWRAQLSAAQNAASPNVKARIKKAAPAKEDRAAPEPTPPVELDAWSKEQQRWDSFARHADLIAGLKLTPEKLAKFKELILERERMRYDMEETAAREAIERNSKEWNRAEKVAIAPVEAEIQALLGPETYNAYLALDEQSAVDREVRTIENLQGFLIDAGVPLTREQIRSLALTYYQLKQDGVLTNSDAPHPETGLLPGHEAILSRVADVLSQEQADALRRYYRHLLGNRPTGR